VRVRVEIGLTGSLLIPAAGAYGQYNRQYMTIEEEPTRVGGGNVEADSPS
jgi:hypothetical protein